LIAIDTEAFPTSIFQSWMLLESLLLPPRSALLQFPREITFPLQKWQHAILLLSLLPLNSKWQNMLSEEWSCDINFRRRCIRQVSCYTLLRRFRLPWPLSCCLDASTVFRRSVLTRLVSSSILLVNSPLPVLLTRHGPLKTAIYLPACVYIAVFSPFQSLRMYREYRTPRLPNH